MQDSMQLPSSDGQHQNHNQIQPQQIISPTFQSVISPKGRRLSRGVNMNTASQESLTFSNSTYNKNHFTERSPPLFNMQYINNQNINTLNFRSFDKKQCTFGSNRGHPIEFDKIKEESYLSNFDDGQNQLSLKEQIQLPCFLSNQNSPNRFPFNQNDSLNQLNEEQLQHTNQTILQSKKYIKVNPSTRNDLKQAIVKSIKDKTDQRTLKNSKPNNQKRDSQSKQNISSISKNQQKPKSPYGEKLKISFQAKTKSPLKTQNEDQIPILKQKIKQLQYSLQVESISTEELRVKVSVLNQLLEEKFLQKNGINFKLFKNSSPSLNKSKITSQNQNQNQHNNYHQDQTQNQKDTKSYSNIDLYVEMKVLEKYKQQIEIQYERVQTDLDQKTKNLNYFKLKCQQLTRKLNQSPKTKHQTKTQTSFLHDQSNRNIGTLSQTSNQFSDTKLTIKINQLQDERQTLMEYIENQKSQIQLKDEKLKSITQKVKQQQVKMKETQSYVKLFQQKQKRFTEVQRPKLLSQIRDLTQRLGSQRDQIEKLQMQNNLRQMQFSQSVFRDAKFQSSPEGKFSPLPQSKHSPQQNLIYVRQRSPVIEQKQQTRMQTTPTQRNQNNEHGEAPDAMSLIMLQQQELNILKNQRDYFREQYQLVRSIQKQNYSLRLRNEDLQNQLSSLHQLIEVDDEITF